MISAHQSKFYAYDLTKRCPPESLEKLAGALVDAQVDLNPHQVEAALFAFQSPLSKGALLADEVGLGKTIEAGLVLSQKWAERKRRILIITPANLRKQWHQELQEKFFLPGTILEARSYNAEVKKGNFSPFEPKDSIIICSYQFARGKATDISRIRWDLVIFDEAHRLRNVYKTSNVIANTLKQALKDAPKLLLTATPLQNSLLELYGLVSIIDEHTFGDLKSFREQFANLNDPHIFGILKSRLKPVCHRTLRRQVTAYVPYTERHAVLEKFEPSDSEDKLYHLISDYLQRDNLQALPTGQRTLMTLVLRKLLASSSFAIAGALESIIRRLEAQIKVATPPETTLSEELDEDYEALDETAEEWPEDDDYVEPLSEAEHKAIAREITDLKSFHELAVSISTNRKGEALLTALTQAFKGREAAECKAIIFTESRKTQDYLLRTLANSPFKEGIVLFNGTNNDPRSKEIYAEWLERNKNTDNVTGSKTADMRSALVDYFRDKGQIMIATEAGAEGINLQFCALVVNYDLPWNPQRIEQRIGRCHRYGQKNDVVVINFLNTKNEADARVFELLAKKFLLFEGVFGASDEVLGAIESGVDFEKRIAEIYQRCRTPQEIKAAFDQLQLELSAQINDSMAKTRQQLLENFDAEVHEKLRVSMETGQAYRTQYERNLMALTRFELGDNASFPEGKDGFELKKNPFSASNDIPLGMYELPRRSGEAHFYRLAHPLAEQVLQQAKNRPLAPAEVTFDHTVGPRVTALSPYVGKSGELWLSLFTIETMDQFEDHLLVSAVTDDGEIIEDELARRMLSIPVASTVDLLELGQNTHIQNILSRKKAEIQLHVSERNAALFELEADKLDSWADDLKVALEREIKDVDRQIKEAKRAATIALTLEEKLAGQKQIKSLETVRNNKRRALFEAQDEIDVRREKLIADIEGKLKQRSSDVEIFRIRWRLK